MNVMTENELSKIVIGKAIEIHRELGPGLLESSYQACLKYELEETGLAVETEVALPLIYKKLKLNKAYRIDLIVENKLVVELKCVEKLEPVHSAQILTYLKFSKLKLGLLINFYEKLLKNGIKRYIMSTHE